MTVLIALTTCSSRAVLFLSTSDPSHNTNAPTGSLTNSGWQYQGRWGNFLGTPIAPNYFITAKHVGGTNGQEFVLNGLTYHAIASFTDPDSDLRVWQVAETFPAYARLYTGTNEVGQHLVVFGRGTQRGGPVIVSGRTNGWYWGTADSVQRWGENDVTEIDDGDQGLGDLLAATFDRNGSPNEAHLSVGDSGGAVFIQDGATWKLAGINYSVSGSFSNAADGTVFDAALFDMGGLYIGGGTTWTLITNEVDDVPSAFFSTRISANCPWIYGVLQRITDIELTGHDVRISFSSVSNAQHRVEYKNDLSDNTWTTLNNNITGTGSILSITDTNAASLPQRFYRVGLTP